MGGEDFDAAAAKLTAIMKRIFPTTRKFRSCDPTIGIKLGDNVVYGFRIALVFAALLACNTFTIAEEAQAKLPKDGWWVRYYVMMKTDQPNDTWTVKRTYSLVGTVIENGQKCRWIEMKSLRSTDGKEETDIIKFLIPEKDLWESDKPLDYLVRAWQKLDGGAVEEVQFDQPSRRRRRRHQRRLRVGSRTWLSFQARKGKRVLKKSGKSSNTSRADWRSLGGGTGRMSRCEESPTSGEKHAFNTAFTVWNHATVLPACAAMRQRIEYRRNDVLLLTTIKELVVEDFGTDAKSALPDNS